MIPDTVLLLGYAFLLAVAGPRALAASGWTERAPRLGIAAWQAMTASTVAAAVLAGLSLALPSVHLGFDLSGLLHACLAALRAQYRTPSGVVSGVFGALLAGAIAGRTAGHVGATIWRDRRVQRRHGQALALLGTFDAGLGAIVVPSQQPAVYCLPGRRHQVVVTSAARAALNVAQLSAALAHEEAHVRQRHDLVIAWAAGLARAFPGVPLFRAAQQETARLVEMLADDHAVRRHDPVTLAEALVSLASPAPAAVGLAAGGTVTARVYRLVAPRPPLGIRRGVVAVAGVLLLATLPVLPISDATQSAAAACHAPRSPATISSARDVGRDPATQARFADSYAAS